MELEKRRKIAAASEDCIGFINQYVFTFDPRPDAKEKVTRLILYPFQEDYVREVLKAIDEGYDLETEKSRDMGISWVSLAIRWWLWRFREAYQGLLGSRKEDYVDNGEVDSLFGKLDFITEHMDPDLLPAGFNVKCRTYMKLVNPENGNALIGESSNKNFSRAGRYTDVFFDELGFWPDARSSWQAAGDSTRSRQAVTTPPNEPSFAKALRFSGLVRVLTYHWRLHPSKDDAWYAYQKTRRTEDEMLHEIDISWEYSKSGRPYPEADRVPFGQFPYDPLLPLYTSWDLGLDAVALGYWQPVPNTDWITLVDCYENSNEIIDFYLPFVGKPMQAEFFYNDADLDFIDSIKYWKPAIHYGDPSGNARHIESKTSAYTILRGVGINVQTNDLMNDFQSRLNETKRLMARLRVNDTPRTRWWHQCVTSSVYPKREETSQATNPIAKPVHDWTSHHRTQTEFFSVNYKPLNQQANIQAKIRDINRRAMAGM